MKRLLAALVLGLVTSLAQASLLPLWNFSYQFASGDVVSGSFRGTKHRDFVENIQDIKVSFNDTALVGNPFIDAFGYDFNTGRFSESVAPRVSPILSLSNFIFVNTFERGVLNNDPINDFTIVNDPLNLPPDAVPLVRGSINIIFPSSESAFDTPGVQSRWHLAQAVPEPSPLILLPLALGLLAWRRRSTGIKSYCPGGSILITSSNC